MDDQEDNVTIAISIEDDFKIITSECFASELDSMIMKASSEQEVYLQNKIEVMSAFYAGYIKALEAVMTKVDEFSFSFVERVMDFKPIDFTRISDKET